MKYRIFLILAWLYSLLHIYIQSEDVAIAVQRLLVVGVSGLIIIGLSIWFKLRKKYKNKKPVFGTQHINLKHDIVNTRLAVVSCGMSRVNRVKNH